MNKEEMIHILNQYGLDVLYEVFQNNIELSYSDGYDIGYGDGWNECYDVFTDDYSVHTF